MSSVDEWQSNIPFTPVIRAIKQQGKTMIEDSKSALIATHTRLKNEFNQSPYPSLDERKRCLAVVKSQLLTLRDEFVAAANEDFGSRSEVDTLIADIMPSVTAIEYIERHLSKWMRKQKRAARYDLVTFKGIEVEVVPKGVVGVIAPWELLRFSLL